LKLPLSSLRYDREPGSGNRDQKTNPLFPFSQLPLRQIIDAAANLSSKLSDRSTG
jgi:hypothetical protein